MPKIVSECVDPHVFQMRQLLQRLCRHQRLTRQIDVVHCPGTSQLKGVVSLQSSDLQVQGHRLRMVLMLLIGPCERERLHWARRLQDLG